MPIKFGSSGGGSGLPHIRYSASVGSWTKSVGKSKEGFEPNDAPMIFDIEHIQQGWLLLEKGNRDWKPWRTLMAPTKKPDGDYREGFRVLVYCKKLLGEEVHEFSNNSVGSTRFIEELHNECEPMFGQGKVPVVQITGSKSEKIGMGNTCIPLFKIVEWIDRPPVLYQVLTLKFDDDGPPVNSAPKATGKALADAAAEF